MNRSYSKIRHIQETNMLLEQRNLKRNSFIFESDDYEIRKKYLSKMNDYSDSLSTDRFLDQFDLEKGEIKPGEHRTHPEGIKQTRRFLNGVITRLSKMLKDFKEESKSEEDYETLEKRAFNIYNDFAEKLDEYDAMPNEESFSKFKKYIDREYKYDI